MRLIIITSLLFALSLPGMAQRTKINAARDVTGTLPVANGGTGQTTQQAAIDALLPAQSGHAGEYLKTNGTTASWAADSGTLAIEANGSAVGSEATLNFITGTGITETITDAGTKINKTTAVDTAVMLTRAQAQSGADLLCAPASASGANYTCSMTPALSAYTTGMVIQFKPDVSSSAGAVTLNINSLGSLNIKQSDGTTDPGASALVAGRQVPLTYDGTVLRMGVAGSGGGSGTVTSVGMSVPSEFSVSGSPVTTSGTLAVSKATQSANTVWAGPTTGSAAAPAFRALVPADLPNTTVTPGAYTNANITVDAQGRLTAAANGSGGSAKTIAAWRDNLKFTFVDEMHWTTPSSSMYTISGSLTSVSGQAGHPGVYSLTSQSASYGRAYNRLRHDPPEEDSSLYPIMYICTIKTAGVISDYSTGCQLAGSVNFGSYNDNYSLSISYSSGRGANWYLLNRGSSADTFAVDTGVAVTADTWYTLSFIISADNSTVPWYIKKDGSAATTGTQSGTPLTLTNPGDMMFGVFNATSSGTVVTLIDRLVVTNEYQ